LGAPGVAAHVVKKRSRFRAIYGPIRAEDLPAFLDSGLKATPAMRRKSFTVWERAVVIPIEFVQALRVLLLILPVFLIGGGLAGSGNFAANVWTHGLFAAAALFTAVFTGAVLTPLLLPYIPGRAFSVKGLLLGVLGALFLFGVWDKEGGGAFLGLDRLAWLLLIPTLSAFLGMNFTGASTYTSLSGVKKEMGRAVPFEIAGGGIGLILWFGALFLKN
jgi:acetyl-CoA decarbonylase/synthase complex subunit gamma